MQYTAWLALAFLLFIIGLVLLFRERQEQKKRSLRLQKLFASQLYQDMKPFLHMAAKHDIERLSVDKTGVAVRFFRMETDEYAYLLRPNGYSYFSSEQQDAMRSLLEIVLPKLSDSRSYAFGRKRIILVNGEVEYEYIYAMTHEYKSSLSRAPYYQNGLQPRLW